MKEFIHHITQMLCLSGGGYTDLRFTLQESGKLQAQFFSPGKPRALSEEDDILEASTDALVIATKISRLEEKCLRAILASQGEDER